MSMTLAPKRKLPTLLQPPMSQKQSDKIHHCRQCWRMPSNIRTGCDRRHVIDAGSEKEIADTLATTNETEAICQDPSVLPVVENGQQDPRWPWKTSHI